MIIQTYLYYRLTLLTKYYLLFIFENMSKNYLHGKSSFYKTYNLSDTEKVQNLLK